MGGDLAQNAAMIAVAIVTAMIGVFRYLKTEAGKDKPATSDTSAVVSASFIDSRLLRELIDTLKTHMEEFGKENRRMNRTRAELTTAMEESTDAILLNTDALINIVRFIKRRDAQQGYNNPDET